MAAGNPAGLAKVQTRTPIHAAQRIAQRLPEPAELR